LSSKRALQRNVRAHAIMSSMTSRIRSEGQPDDRVIGEALSGSDVLGLIERRLEDSRRELETVDERLARTTHEHDRLRQAELGVLGVLARVRLREIERGELLDALDETVKRVTALLAQRGEALAGVGVELAKGQEALAQIEQERTAQHARVNAAERALDAVQAEAQRQLSEDAQYRAQLDKAKASDGVADLADAKSKAAHTDRTEKGKPYEADPLFTYLWSRGYGTSRYRAGPLARLLDGWVARTVDFEPLRRNYSMLTELPARFDEHAERMRALADDDVRALRALEVAAAESAGVRERERGLAGVAEALAAIDAKIAEREAAIAALVAERARFAAGEDDLSRQCTQLLSETFRKEQMRTLRERANRTPSPEDDAAVDELTVIRAHLPRLVEEVASRRAQHDALRARAERFEEIRKRFKEQHFDAVASEFVNGALIETLLVQLASGALGVPDFWDALTKQQRLRNLSADPRFGSGRFRRGRGPWYIPGGAGGYPDAGTGSAQGGSVGGFGTGGSFGGGGGFNTGGGF
jgi:hypothetical protein